jgi:hypothetical protein
MKEHADEETVDGRGIMLLFQNPSSVEKPSPE